jgi:putative hemolysin
MELVVIVLLILLNGLFALAEIAFVTADPHKLRELAAQSKAAQSVIKLRQDPAKFLSTIQVCITLIGIIAGAFSGLVLADDLSRVLVRVPFIAAYAYQISLVLLVLVVTYFSIVFGELIPKAFALRDPERSIVGLIGVVRGFSILFYPFVAVLSGSVKLFFRLTGLRIRSDEKEADLVRQILSATRIALVEQKIEMEQEAIIKKAVLINQIRISEIMVHWPDVNFLDAHLTLMDALVEAHEHQHNRYPVLDKEQNKIIGYINFKDIINVLKFDPQNPSLRSICRPILRLQENESIIGALKTMTKNFQHIALIVNARGEERGVVTLEDILEVLVGDIGDEYDLLPEYIYRIAENRYVAGGSVNVAALHDMGLSSLPHEKMSLSAWLAGRVRGRLKVNARILVGDIRFIVKKMRRKHIFEVIIESPVSLPGVK